MSDEEVLKVIRQAISCDICGSEKKQTNHWFVAYERDGELRLSGWQSKHTLRPKVKHLCGQKCVHRLMDEYMAVVSSIADAAGTSLEREPSEQLLDVPEGVVLLQPEKAEKPEKSEKPEKPTKTDRSLLAKEEPRKFTSESWRKEAWKHEIERQSHEASLDEESGIVSRRMN